MNYRYHTMKEKHDPCLGKKCSWCCNPVKVSASFPDEKIPTDEFGDTLWKDREEIIAPESKMERVRLKTFDCKWYDPKSGKCREYEHRPEICRGTSCIDEHAHKTIDQQH